MRNDFLEQNVADLGHLTDIDNQDIENVCQHIDSDYLDLTKMQDCRIELDIDNDQLMGEEAFVYNNKKLQTSYEKQLYTLENNLCVR